MTQEGDLWGDLFAQDVSRAMSVHDKELGKLMETVCDVAEAKYAPEEQPPLALVVAIEEYVVGWHRISEPPPWLARMRAIVDARRHLRAMGETVGVPAGAAFKLQATEQSERIGSRK